MNKGAVISQCGRYRYQLWRIWNDDKPLVLFVCLNPSTADANTDDPTLRRIMGFVYQMGCGGFYLGNLFALRSPYPSDLRYGRDPVGPENDRHLREMADKAQRVVFAWGNDGDLNKRHLQVREMFPAAMCFGLTKAGHPRHPLYLPKDSQLIPYPNGIHISRRSPDRSTL